MQVQQVYERAKKDYMDTSTSVTKKTSRRRMSLSVLSKLGVELETGKHYMLLLLNEFSFHGLEGERLANDVRPPMRDVTPRDAPSTELRSLSVGAFLYPPLTPHCQMEHPKLATRIEGTLLSARRARASLVGALGASQKVRGGAGARAARGRQLRRVRVC